MLLQSRQSRPHKPQVKSRQFQLTSDCDSPPSLDVKQLALRYRETRVLEDVNLSIPAGKITALIGPSGCGKTSFLNCLNRLIDLTPQTRMSGQIQLEGRDIQQFPVIELRRQVGMLFQKPNPFPLSIYRNIEFPLREHGVCDRNEIDTIIETALKDVGLWHEVKDRLKSPALALSGGQQQRLCLARALALKPCVILMDEPCSALDPISSEIVEDLICQLKGDYTVVVVTHNLAQARRVADQVALFWVNEGVGQVIESGPTQQVFSEPQHSLTKAYVSGRRG
ncbi:Phosphate import ATP-binding protein PstB 3 [Acaryochloris thomasi RCC1774]|uniref:Phosphate import ATP-binding protein PstB 3 n=1 Tax=Acaryochloris thomasi RCC1774 TaxID=1764569 RepID=A0A2W1JGG1_9CYAN|nr:phosphate ABC transporter ATP-binding protein [Acaryochloris thomasi]PZD72669.1 Phosphate import ATP-binding protein PstB 3 [Acaryochloris thomasi RCC1774]